MNINNASQCRKSRSVERPVSPAVITPTRYVNDEERVFFLFLPRIVKILKTAHRHFSPPITLFPHNWVLVAHRKSRHPCSIVSEKRDGSSPAGY